MKTIVFRVPGLAYAYQGGPESKMRNCSCDTEKSASGDPVCPCVGSLGPCHEVQTASLTKRIELGRMRGLQVSIRHGLG